MEYSRNYPLRASDFDSSARLTPRAILELFQDVAGSHAEKLGIGFEPLIKKNLIWVIARTKFVIEKPVARYSTVKVKTWPLNPQKLIFRREHLIYDESGEIVVRGSADWLIVNSITRKLAFAENIFPENAEYFRELAINEKLKKIKDIEGKVVKSTVVPQFTDIDLNGHINNTKYADFAINALPQPIKNIKTFQIDYHSEALEGEQLNLVAVINDKKSVINGENNKNEKKFTCEIEFE